ncbi:MAG: hypothetical protein HQM10_20405 [Candidatus Riflebacteria bacterium]|nr:hypothetical protein [Candidatus Riflebacteria bacterium]
MEVIKSDKRVRLVFSRVSKAFEIENCLKIFNNVVPEIVKREELVLDCSMMSETDSAFMQFMLVISREIKKRGLCVRVESPSQNLWKMACLFGLTLESLENDK